MLPAQFNQIPSLTPPHFMSDPQQGLLQQLSYPDGNLPRTPEPSSPSCLVLNPSHLCPDPLAPLNPVAVAGRRVKPLSFPLEPLPARVLQNAEAAPTASKPLDSSPHLNPQPHGASQPSPSLRVQDAPPNLLISFLPGNTTWVSGTQVEDWACWVGRDGEIGTCKMEAKTGTGMGRLGTLDQMRMGFGETVRPWDMGPREMEF